jgi:hypothetical protein
MLGEEKGENLKIFESLEATAHNVNYGKILKRDKINDPQR